uniref:Uncharacterized protein n=1 Tax=Anguilla anguilla TaxID=7936 RepID=A0A0E9WS42_ANGAN
MQSHKCVPSSPGKSQFASFFEASSKFSTRSGTSSSSSSISSALGALLSKTLLCKFAQAGQAVGTQLTEDAREHLCELLRLCVARDSEGVGRQRGLHLGVVEVNHSPIVLDHVHLLNTSNVVNSQFL